MGNGLGKNHQETPLSPDVIAIKQCQAMALEAVKQIDAQFPVETGTPEDVINDGLRRFYRGQIERALQEIESAIGSGKATEPIRQSLLRAMTNETFDILKRIIPTSDSEATQ